MTEQPLVTLEPTWNPNITRTIACDSQIVSTSTACERRAELTFIRNLASIENPKAESLERGELIHLPLKVYYTLKKRTDKFTFNDRVELAVGFARKKALELDLDLVESELVISTFVQYCNHFKSESWVPSQVEEPFSVLLFESEELNIRILYEGVIDLVVEGYGGAQGNIVDHKSTKSRFTPLELSYQFMGYCWATGNRTLTAQQIGFQKSLEPKDKFLRFTYSYTTNQLNEWRATVVRRILNWVKCIETEDFPPNWNSCKMYNAICPYYQDYCKVDPDARSWKLQTKFQERAPWDVFKRDEIIDIALDELLKD